MASLQGRSLYENPEYYEMASSFRDIAKEIEVMKQCIRLHSGIPVRRVLEIGCGPSPHMLGLLGDGYEYVGLDLSDAMLAYAQQKANSAGFSPILLRQDMTDFTLSEQVDFAFVLLGSIYAKDTLQQLHRHFHCVAEVLKGGGLYFLDWCVEFGELSEKSDSWGFETMQSKDGILRPECRPCFRDVRGGDNCQSSRR